MSNIKDIDTKYFRLLLPASRNLNDVETIELCGKQWIIVGFDKPSDAPPYTCISYSWGEGRIENVFSRDSLISDRTVSVIETVVNSLYGFRSEDAERRSTVVGEADRLAMVHNASEAIWIDSLCMPQQKNYEELCIQNMREIYREAAQVFVVLNPDCTNTIQKIYNGEKLNLSDFEAITGDDWIDRVWTYPEFLNSKMMFLLAESKRKTIFIGEMSFLNALMTDSDVCADGADIELPYKLRRMEHLLAEQQIKERSAFQTMSGVNKRIYSRPEDRINAMIAVVGDTKEPVQDRASITASEYFMRVCEENNDYSFIFSTNSRSEVPGRSWRPVGDEITPVISDVAAQGGKGLSGVLKETHLQMNDMCRMAAGKNNSILNLVGSFLDVDFPKVLLERLRVHGFTGCGQCIRLEQGYFFPQSPHKRPKEYFVAVAPEAKFYQGAPGLLLRSNGTDIDEFCDVGVFIGKIPKTCESINVS